MRKTYPPTAHSSSRVTGASPRTRPRMRQLRRVTKTMRDHERGQHRHLRETAVEAVGERDHREAQECGDGTEVHVRLAVDEEALERHLLRGDVPAQVEEAVRLDVVEVPEALGVERVELAGVDHPVEDEERE